MEYSFYYSGFDNDVKLVSFFNKQILLFYLKFYKFFVINVYAKRFDNSLVRKWVKYYTENGSRLWLYKKIYKFKEVRRYGTDYEGNDDW